MNKEQMKEIETFLKDHVTPSRSCILMTSDAVGSVSLHMFGGFHDFTHMMKVCDIQVSKLIDSTTHREMNVKKLDDYRPA